MKVLAWPGWANKYHNPYTALLCTWLQRMGMDVEEYKPRHLLFPQKIDVLHLHWPDGLFQEISPVRQLYKLALFFREMTLAKLWRIRIIWTAHNLRPHCRRNEVFEALFYKMWLSMVDGMIFLSHHSQSAFHERYPKSKTIPHCVIPHGHYRDLILEQRTPDEAKRLLGLPLEMRYFVFIGKIRPYKNIPRLIECFKLANIDNWGLLIAGLPGNDASAQQLRALAASDPRITLNFELLTEEQFEIHTQAAELVVLPYQSVLNSGSLIYALSCNRCALVPKSETFCELRDLTKAEGIFMYEDVLKPEDLQNSIKNLRPITEVTLDALDWNNIARLHEAFFKEVIEGVSKSCERRRESPVMRLLA
jgi:glycosyltransferase involved in cell wall biosynthesis